MGRLLLPPFFAGAWQSFFAKPKQPAPGKGGGYSFTENKETSFWHVLERRTFPSKSPKGCFFCKKTRFRMLATKNLMPRFRADDVKRFA